MAIPSIQRKQPLGQANSLPPSPPRQSLLQFQFLVAGAAADGVQAHLLLAFGTTLETRFPARLGLRSSLHDRSPLAVKRNLGERQASPFDSTHPWADACRSPGLFHSSCIDAPVRGGNAVLPPTPDDRSSTLETETTSRQFRSNVAHLSRAPLRVAAKRIFLTREISWNAPSSCVSSSCC